MLGNIFFSTAIAITLMFSASATYKSYSDLQEAKQIQESYEIISDIKYILSKQYNKSPNDITRDEIISMLPVGGNWEKVLLSNRNSDLANDALINEDGNFVLNEEQRIKVMALRVKLQNISNINSSIDENKQITFIDDNLKNNYELKDSIITTNINKTIEILHIEKDVLTTSGALSDLINAYVPYEYIYKFDTNAGKEMYFKNEVIQKLLTSQSSKDINTYNQIKGLL